MTLAYKKYLSDLVFIKDGYLTNAEAPHDTTFNSKFMSCEEANIIIKIIQNTEKYFDFDKAILDIGAFVGVYSFMTPFKFAYCFEPNFESYSLLNVNMLHHDKKFKSYNVLLSDKEETIKFLTFQLINIKKKYIDDLLRKYIQEVNEQMRAEEEAKLRKEAEFERDVEAGNITSFEMIMGDGSSEAINITEQKIQRILKKKMEAEMRKQKENELKNKSIENDTKINEQMNSKETDL